MPPASTQIHERGDALPKVMDAGWRFVGEDRRLSSSRDVMRAADVTPMRFMLGREQPADGAGAAVDGRMITGP